MLVGVGHGVTDAGRSEGVDERREDLLVPLGGQLLLLGLRGVLAVHRHVAAHLVVGPAVLRRRIPLVAAGRLLLPAQGRHEQALALRLLEPVVEVARRDVLLGLGEAAQAHGLQPSWLLGLHRPDGLELVAGEARPAAHSAVQHTAYLLVLDLLVAADEELRQADGGARRGRARGTGPVHPLDGGGRVRRTRGRPRQGEVRGRALRHPAAVGTGAPLEGIVRAGDLLPLAVVGAGHGPLRLLPHVVDLLVQHLVADVPFPEDDVRARGVREGVQLLGRALGDRVVVHPHMAEVHLVRLLGAFEDVGVERPAGGADGVAHRDPPLDRRRVQGGVFRAARLLPGTLDGAGHRRVPGGLLERGQRGQGAGPGPRTPCAPVGSGAAVLVPGTHVSPSAR